MRDTVRMESEGFVYGFADLCARERGREREGGRKREGEGESHMNDTQVCTWHMRLRWEADSRTHARADVTYAHVHTTRPCLCSRLHMCACACVRACVRVSDASARGRTSDAAPRHRGTHVSIQTHIQTIFARTNACAKTKSCLQTHARAHTCLNTHARP
jgi:hypothetical protein